MGGTMYTAYITPKRELFISDPEGNLLNPNDLKKENKKAIYDLERSQLKVVSTNGHVGYSSSLIPYDHNDSPVHEVAARLLVDLESLSALVKKRRKELDDHWAEYHRIFEIVTIYTTNKLPVPKSIREKLEARLKLHRKDDPKKLVDLIIEQ